MRLSCHDYTVPIKYMQVRQIVKLYETLKALEWSGVKGKNNDTRTNIFYIYYNTV